MTKNTLSLQLVLSLLMITGCRTRPGLVPAPSDSKYIGLPSAAARSGYKDTFAVSHLDGPLRQLHMVNPNYPGHLSAKRKSGIARIGFVITPTGDVAEARVIHASHEDFGASALSAVSQWKFAPPIRNGKAVSVRVIQDLPFIASAGQ